MHIRFLIAGLLCSAAGAHDLYILPSDFFPTTGSRVTLGYHTGDSFPESEVAAHVERLLEPKLTWKGGSAALTGLHVDGTRVAASAGIAAAGEIVATVHTRHNLLELDAPKFTEYLKEEGLTEIIEWRKQHGEAAKRSKERYSKYAKSMLLNGASNGYAMQPVGFIIEIVPEADPYALKPGSELPVRVLFRGKPAAGLQIETAWASKSGRKTMVVGRTGVDGRLKVPLPAAGLWRIHTIKMERCAEPAAADWESFWASATFELR